MTVITSPNYFVIYHILGSPSSHLAHKLYLDLPYLANNSLQIKHLRINMMAPLTREQQAFSNNTANNVSSHICRTLYTSYHKGYILLSIMAFLTCTLCGSKNWISHSYFIPHHFLHEFIFHTW